MKKLVLVPVLMMVACVLAGVYGVLHDQISYTVSPDYFHAFKFHQFQITDSSLNRWGAAIVGWQATWWMGVIIGLPILSIGWIFADAEVYAKQCLWAFAVVALTALIFGVGALLYARFAIGPDNLPPYLYPELVIDKVAFARVGTMHNFSYLGGVVGIFVAIVYMAFARKNQKNS